MKKIFIFVLLILLAGKVFAENFESERYKIQFGDLNIGGENSLNSDNYDLSVSLGQTAAGQFQSDGYFVKAGFQYIHSTIPFKFSISNVNIDLGTLIPNSPAEAATTLTVSFGRGGYYQVTTAETASLKKSSGVEIPDTDCNGADDSCTETSAKKWTENKAYGFGYNMTGSDIPVDFINKSYFRRFPNLSEEEAPQTVMSSPNVGRNRQAQVTFKANISALQEAGTYQSVIKFTAQPSY